MLDLRKANNELKSFVNQAEFISRKTRNKLISLLAIEFDINLPLENYANVDVQLTKEGNILMRGDLYERSNPLSATELEEKYLSFKEKANNLINKKEVNFYDKKNMNNFLNIIIVLILSCLYLIIAIFLIMAVLGMQFLTAAFLGSILSTYLIPNIKDRFQQAKNFLKRKFTGKK